MRAIVVPDQDLAIQQLAPSFKIGASHPLKMFQKMLGLMASASPALKLGLLRMRPLQYWLKPRVPSHAWHHRRLRIRVDQACVEALIPWKNSQWMERGVPLGMVCRRKVVTTDASNTGWGALTQASQGTETQTPSGVPSLEKPALVLRAVPAARSSPRAHFPETRPPLSGEQDNTAPPAKLLALHLCGEDTDSCDISVILSFLQELLDKGRSPSTLKVYVAAITASHAPIAGQSVLRALKGPPFEPLLGSDLRSLTFKAALLLALASVKHMGDLQELSVSPSCLEFGPTQDRKPRHGYVPKVPSTPFWTQVITLSALPCSEEDQELNLLCPVRALRMYNERSASFRQSEQLFVCFGGCNKGHPVRKQRLSRCIVNAITLAYSSLEICAAAGWATPSTFTRFYNLDVPSCIMELVLCMSELHVGLSNESDFRLRLQAVLISLYSRPQGVPGQKSIGTVPIASNDAVRV
ncbi:Regulatory protein PqrA [Labeo rohita]|uniref:Regulatory protein PqrA n=1 Tax=Labeo rohita TaxID=84645 RepID=A0ABQ8L150_LABRO|nr:Regulatory protein PqrA [Labeo rohita]